MTRQDILDALALVERLAAEGRANMDLVYRLRAVRDDLCSDPACQLSCLAECRLPPDLAA